jgi:hypothetical protein
MRKRRFTLEQIITNFGGAERFFSNLYMITEIPRQTGIVERIYYLWRKEYGEDAGE